MRQGESLPFSIDHGDHIAENRCTNLLATVEHWRIDDRATSGRCVSFGLPLLRRFVAEWDPARIESGR